MKPSSNLLFAFGLFLILMAVVVAIATSSPLPRLGSVVSTGEYNSTSTDYMAAGKNTVTSNRVTTLGSVVITGVSTTTVDFTIWDAASSSVDSGSSTVAVIKGGTAAGTYTFDVSLLRGLIVDKPTGFDGKYTVTYRPQ
jgi:hypothetical protein